MIIVHYHYVIKSSIEEDKHRWSRKVFADDDINGLQAHLDTLEDRENIQIMKV